ncbi:MAG TPA: phage tail tip lysozyme [Methylosinus sp.]|uniref:phage tail tip lysozyme n=1 Tax=Methylosinus sp. TaxID=427 RepID=UPI002F9490E2
MADNPIASAASAAANGASGFTPGQILGALLLAGLLGAVGQGARAIVGLKKMNDEAQAKAAGQADLFVASRINVSLVIGFIAGVITGISMGISRLLSIKPDDVQLLLGIAASGYAGVDFLEAFTRNLGGAARTPGGGGPAAPPKIPAGGGKPRTLSALRQNQIEAYREARQQGLGDLAARALVANMTGESLANPRDEHWDVHHRSQGIVQWDPSRAEAIRKQFGRYPKEMSVAEQTAAAIWEIRSVSRFARTRGALDHGASAGEIIDALVRNYEVPAKPDLEIRKRLAFFDDLPPLSGSAVS